MRVLISTTPGLGHVLPVVPLAQALLQQGHDVLWATGSDVCDVVTTAGISAAPAGLSVAEMEQHRPALLAGAAGLRPDQLASYMFPNLFGRTFAPPMLRDLLPLAREWRPDLLLHEQGELAAPLVAAVLGVPSVVQAFGSAVPADYLDAAASHLAPLWASQGRAMPPYAGCYETAYLDIYPPTLQGSGAAHIGTATLLRPVSYTGPQPAELPSLVTDRDDRPLVYITLGTVPRSNALFGPVLAGVSRLDVRVVATVGPLGDLDAAGVQPANVHVAHYLSQTAVLPRCDLVVSHAGSGTAVGALSLGLPQVCLPQAADQFRNATALERAGAAVVVLPPVHAEAVTAAVTAVLGDGRWAAAAAGLAAEIGGMPSPDDVVATLVVLAG